MLEPLNNAQIRKFKAASQHLEPILKVGKAGLTDGFIASVNEALTQHELVKIKFVEFKDQKKELAPHWPKKLICDVMEIFSMGDQNKVVA